MKRTHQLLLIGSILPLSWLLMMAIHEFGHVLGSWLTGGSVTKVVLHPLAFSRTDLAVNPHPFIVCAAGPLFGSLLPLAVLAASRKLKWGRAYLLQFFAAFCCVINGAYIGLGSFEGVGDAGDLMQLGAAKWQLWLFGAAASAAGFYFFNGLSVKFGFGEANGEVDSRAAYILLALLSLVVALELALSSRL